MSSIQETREKFSGRIGEIIEATIGIDTVKRIFEAAQNGDTEAQAQIAKAEIENNTPPSGFLALKLGVVDAETKNALLTVNAAVQTLNAVEQIEELYNVHKSKLEETAAAYPSEFKQVIDENKRRNAIDEYYKENIKPANDKDPMFGFIGKDPSDPDTLVRAQATLQLATEYEQNEKGGVKEQVKHISMKVPDYEPIGTGYIDGFKASAAESFKESAKIFEAKGKTELAAAVNALAESVTFDADNAKAFTPARFAQEAVGSQYRLALEVNIILDPCATREPPYASVNDEWVFTMGELAGQSMLRISGSARKSTGPAAPKP